MLPLVSHHPFIILPSLACECHHMTEASFTYIRLCLSGDCNFLAALEKSLWCYRLHLEVKLTHFWVICTSSQIGTHRVYSDITRYVKFPRNMMAMWKMEVAFGLQCFLHFSHIRILLLGYDFLKWKLLFSSSITGRKFLNKIEINK